MILFRTLVMEDPETDLDWGILVKTPGLHQYCVFLLGILPITITLLLHGLTDAKTAL